MKRRRWTNGQGATGRIAIDPDILHGKPRIKGTRIGVSMVLELLAGGISPTTIRRRFYPDLTVDDIYACIEFANRLLSGEELHIVLPRTRRRLARA